MKQPTKQKKNVQMDKSQYKSQCDSEVPSLYQEAVAQGKRSSPLALKGFSGMDCGVLCLQHAIWWRCSYGGSSSPCSFARAQPSPAVFSLEKSGQGQEWCAAQFQRLQLPNELPCQ